MGIDPSTPRYTQPDVLRITGLKPAVLQTWINRRAIELAEQNPGSGRRRLYSEIDVVKLAVMRRLFDLSIDLAVSKDLAEAAAEVLVKEDGFSWNEYLFLRGATGTRSLNFTEVSARSALEKCGSRKCDPQTEPLSTSIYWRVDQARMAETMLGQVRFSTEVLRRPLSEDEREAYARRGLHAEPVVVFPIGEIVNGTLAQLETLDEARDTQGGA